MCGATSEPFGWRICQQKTYMQLAWRYEAVVTENRIQVKHNINTRAFVLSILKQVQNKTVQISPATFPVHWNGGF